ncbi:hypothetical protein HWV62_11778 [Athelia sp. TMB]|nr:hypothetical protein HWV62_11778 [Athelia sp. TMB]
MGRIIWFHVPPRLTPRTPEEISSGTIKRSKEEMAKVMAEKRMALDLIEGFAVALKHHIRGELGIYYDDLYHLVRPLHEHFRKENKRWVHDHPDAAVLQSPTKLQVPAPPLHHPHPRQATSTSTTAASSSSHLPAPIPTDPVIPSITAYGTFDPAHPSRSASRRSSSSASTNSDASEHRPLLPSQFRPDNVTIGSMVSRDLIPFESVWTSVIGLFKRKPKLELPGPDGVLNDGLYVEPNWSAPSSVRAKMSHKGTHGKHRPMVAGGGQNLPLTILRCMSEWVSVIDDRGTTYGNPNSALYTYISNFEDNLSAIERILTTPLPLHTVWIYLFFLPFQLIDQFGWTTIPGVGIAAFIYLGFLAAGEEIEQPFGYDENDLDLDLFCQEIVHKDLDGLKSTPCLNAYFSHHGAELAQRSIVETSAKIPVNEQEQDVFGSVQ